MSIADETGSGELLAQAWRAIAEAQATEHAEQRFERASVAAVRAASAVLAGCPDRVRGARAQSVWTLVARCAPELREWADFFAATTRACVRLRSQGDATGGITQRLADDLLRDADRFTHEVRGLLLRRRTRRLARAASE
ncbi:SAV_6107 family HEPN domain-containing protein [Blastococcus sp. Marseille-P5729]|uniref:SAV_6107 family HEPN domain-containing protein n=1 Tax=Blastococcus sp. Marseille-P5729 TaxID=2086582 RepID=UPI000D0FB8CA|nr:SAV_6107 family HEPN domain-containing protein [Blastococcus sp. Marseille-P5729]